MTISLARLIAHWYLRRLPWPIILPAVGCVLASTVAVWGARAAQDLLAQHREVVSRLEAAALLPNAAVPKPAERLEAQLAARIQALPSGRDAHLLVGRMEAALRQPGMRVIGFSVQRSSTTESLTTLRIEARLEGEGPKILSAVDRVLAIDPSVALALLELDRGDSPARSWTTTVRFDVLMHREPS
jgi:hypothetical protein